MTAKKKDKADDKLEGDPSLDSTSSGDNKDPLNTVEDRRDADPALEPELAWEEDEKKRAEAQA